MSMPSQTENMPMQRIVVVGSSCSGKTTFTRALSAKLRRTHIELDTLYWQPNWTERPAGEFRALIEEAISTKAWIVDGNYSVARDLVWPNATTIIWLNYSFTRILYQGLKRTIHRVVTKEELFAGNVETFRQSFLSTNSILLWVITTFHSRRARYRQLLHDELSQKAQVIEFKHPREAEAFLKHFF